MDAITAELHNLAVGCTASGDELAAKICRDAIAEVERLRAENKRLQIIDRIVKPAECTVDGSHWGSRGMVTIHCSFDDAKALRDALVGGEENDG